MKKRSTAWAILAVVVVLGALFGTHRSLSSLRSAAVEAFYEDANGDQNYGISKRLSQRVEVARNLCKIAGNYDLRDACQWVEDACSQLEAAKDYSAMYGANTALTDAVETLNQAMQQQTLTEEHEQYRKELTTQLSSYEQMIDKLAPGFNEGVRQFNDDILGGFPANILGRLTGIRELEEYA